VNWQSLGSMLRSFKLLMCKVNLLLITMAKRRGS
jgi:hypothetical protein